MKKLLRTVDRHTSAGGLGFAGAGGLVASGLTDIASTMGPLLTWFVVIASIMTIVLGIAITRLDRQEPERDSSKPSSLGTLCHVFVVLVGALFGSAVLLASSLFTDNEDGSNILAILAGLRSDVQRVEEKVAEVKEGVAGLGESIVFRDISGRSGTGKIGQTAKFAITLANERRMDDATCELEVDAPWDDYVEVIDDTCHNFTVQLPKVPVMDENGRSMGDIVSIPFRLIVSDRRGDEISSYANVYPLHNTFGTIEIVVDPPGNRFNIDETRTLRVHVGESGLTDAMECEWTAFDPVKITPRSDNGCIAELSTHVDKNSYVYKRLRNEGRIRDEIYVQIDSVADFTMIGNATMGFVVSP